MKRGESKNLTVVIRVGDDQGSGITGGRAIRVSIKDDQGREMVSGDAAFG